MLRRLIEPIQTAILCHPRTVLGISLALVFLALLAGLRVEFRTSRSELAPPDDPDQKRWTELLSEYRGSEALIACAEHATGGGTAEELRSLADALAVEFERRPRIDHVFYKLDVEWFERHGLHLVPAETLRQAGDVLESGELGALDGVADLAQLVNRLAERLERDFGSSGSPPDGAAEGVAQLAQWIEGQRAFLDDPSAVLTPWIDRSPWRVAAGTRGERLGDGYLATHDERTLFLFLTPSTERDDLASYRSLVATMREVAGTVLERYPGYRVAFTGQPAIVVEEMDTVRRDTWLTAGVAILGVSLLTLYVFRWRSHSLLVLLSLAAGVAWSFGAVLLELGYLNLITSSFVSTLVGIGVAYGIHPVSEYELQGAHTEDPRSRVRESFRRTGPGVTVAAVTTSAAFFSILLMRFRGFAELGLVAGFGVLLCLLAATVTLPAALVLYGTWRHRRDRQARDVALVDRVWSSRLAASICRAPRSTLTLAAVVTAAALWGGAGIGGLSTNIFNLLPSGAESLRYQRRMILDSELSPLFNLVVADDLERLAEMRERAAAQPAIERFDSILDLLPPGDPVSRDELESWRARVEALQLPASATPVTAQNLAAANRRLEAALADAADAAFGAGLAELVAPLENARAAAEGCAARAQSATEADAVRWNEAQQRVLDWVRDARALLVAGLAAEAPTVESLPQAMRDRFLTASGKPLGFLYPVESVFSPTELRRFVEASREVSAEVTGFPLVFYKSSQRITGGFYRAVGLGFVLVLIILMIDYRNPRDALLALAPLALGLVWLLGAMRVLGLSFNFANLVAVPLIIGVGIDNGVHVIHRVRLEGRAGMVAVLRHTGRAIFIASLTTMVGFGSLALASHRGMASLGGVLFLGVGACLITSTIVLPNLLVALGIVDR
ncbi:MAG: MMPL family transporter [bacterium]|nr:MMPL family transporter [bacterium]